MSINRETFSKTGNSIYNDQVRKFLAKNIQSWFADVRQFTEMVDLDGYVSDVKEWILSSKECQILGLEHYEESCVSLGVTQALDQFHYDILRSGRKLRMFRGEYPYNRDVHPFSANTDFIDDRPLQLGDAVILSCPFSGSGDVHPQMYKTLDSCHQMQIPVLIDLAWFGTCGGLTIDLSHPAITHTAFSLTKGLTCGNYRSGVRWTRRKERLSVHDRLSLQHEWNHSIHLNAKIGRALMKEFSPDTQFQKYRQAQLQVCQMFGLTPSPCVHIATSRDPSWIDFDRDGFVNRINLREAIKKLINHSSTD
jgi:hypothetical protein